MRSKTIVSLFVGLLVIGACSAGPGATASAPPAATATPTAAGPTASPDERADWPDKIVLGLVPSQEAEALIEDAQPLADALADALDIEVEAYVPQNYTGLVEAMGAGQADVGAFGPGGLVLAEQRYGVEIILQSERFGSATYHTQWMTNDPDKYCLDGAPTADEDGLLGCNGTTEASQGPIGEEALALVEGATVAWVDPASASGYLFPAAQLIDAGLNHETDVTGTFAGAHPAAVIAVLEGDAEVGVSFDDARGGLMEERADVIEVVTFAFSPEIPNDGWTVRKELPESLKDAIKQALLDYADTEAGQTTLDAIYEITGLVEADLAAFQIVRDTAEKVGIPIED